MRDKARNKVPSLNRPVVVAKTFAKCVQFNVSVHCIPPSMALNVVYT